MNIQSDYLYQVVVVSPAEPDTETVVRITRAPGTQINYEPKKVNLKHLRNQQNINVYKYFSKKRCSVVRLSRQIAHFEK